MPRVGAGGPHWAGLVPQVLGGSGLGVREPGCQRLLSEECPEKECPDNQAGSSQGGGRSWQQAGSLSAHMAGEQRCVSR